MWPALTLLLLAALVAWHLRWRARFRREERRWLEAIAELRRQHEHAARETKLQQETFFNSMTDGVLLLDEEGKIQFANRAFAGLFGLGGDLRGKTLLEALRLPGLGDLVERLLEKQNQAGQELRLPGLEERWLEITASAVNPREHGRGSLVVFHEVTRLKKLERTRQEFVANVSHELRTPLSLIKGYVETLLGGAKDQPETATRFLRTIDRNADRLKLLVEDLLTLSELESGRLKLELQRVSPRAAAEKAIADLAWQAEAKRTRLINEVAEAAVRADPHRLEQVWGNLLDNAIKYGRVGGTVTLGSGTTDGGQIELFVQDDGPGIPSEGLERVFERFYRVDKARSREQGGTGLGLAIVKHIVHSHGGKVWAKSQLGHGATFSFTLPLEPATA